MRLFIMILVMAVIANAQTVRWGDNISMGTAFATTDSTKLRTSTITATMTNAMTLYSQTLEATYSDGIYAVDFWMDETSGTHTISLYVRYRSKASAKFTSWYTVSDSKTADGLYRTYISDDATTYGWQPTNIIQYKLVSTGTGTSTVKISDFIK